MKYSGAPWRARFLRAPKIALELASRPDFTPLEAVATVRLGLKTGADEFFFLECLPDTVHDEDLVPQRGLIVVRGQDRWVGQVAQTDLRAAALNPHQLFVGTGRCMSLPNARTTVIRPRIP